MNSEGKKGGVEVDCTVAVAAVDRTGTEGIKSVGLAGVGMGGIGCDVAVAHELLWEVERLGV